MLVWPPSHLHRLHTLVIIDHSDCDTRRRLRRDLHILFRLFKLCRDLSIQNSRGEVCRSHFPITKLQGDGVRDIPLRSSHFRQRVFSYATTFLVYSLTHFDCVVFDVLIGPCGCPMSFLQ